MKRKLTKSPNNVVLTGSLAGIADWLGIDPTIIRVVYVLLSFFSAGFPGILLYIALAVLIPSEEQEAIAATAIKILIIEMFAMKILMLPIKSNVKKQKKLMMTNGVTFNDIFSAIGC